MNTERQFDPERMAERADHYFTDKGLTCSESCLMAGAEALGIEDPLLPDIAIALGGGLGMNGDVCGAVSGCAMAVSLAAKRLAPEYTKHKMMAMGAAGRIYQGVVRECGSALCRDICGLDLTSADGIQKLISGVKDEKCVPAVKAAARLLARELRTMYRGNGQTAAGICTSD